LIQRYLWRVERRLPSAQAADVVAELDSLLRDQLDAKSEAAGRPVNEGMICEVLKAFGSPEEAAARYNPSPRYLIGPAAYPHFLKVVGWVLGILGLVTLLQVFLRVTASQGQGLGGLLLSSLGSWFQGSMISMAWVVLAFAVMERTQSRAWPSKPDWDPRDLPELPRREEDKATQASMILEMLGPILLLLFLNYFPKEGWTLNLGGNRVHVLSFSSLGLHLPMAWINAFLATEILLALAVLEEGRWNTGFRWIKVFLEVAGAALVAWILRSITMPSPETLTAIHPGLHLPPQILETVGFNLRHLGYVIPLLMLISPLKRTYRLLRDSVVR
jgi:hypothetical protein